MAAAPDTPRGDELARRYLRRLGVTASLDADLDTLSDLMQRHMQRVPFENVDVVAGTARGLSTEAVLRKVSVESRGGFCYELNEAFRSLLDYLGFTVRRIEARVWQARAVKYGAPFDHLALVVSLPKADYLVDVGYGDSNRAPLRLPDAHAHDISGDYRLSAADDGMLRLSSAIAPLYEMSLAAQPLQAFAPMCRYHQTSPESIFTQGLICTRATETGRITLSKNRLTIVERGQRSESFVEDVPAALRHYFEISHTAL